MDGSGSGAHARLSANLILSTLYENLSELNDRIHGKKRGSVVRGSDDSAIPSKTPRASSAGERRRSFSNAAATKPPALIVNTGPANSSDIYEWLQKVVVLAHQKCKSVTEAGSSSASFFVILKRAEYSSTFLTSPQDPNNNNQQPTADNFHSNSTIYNPDLDYVCFFAAVGDVEAYHYSKYTGKWSNILKEISPFDRVRIDSTRSPGGIGGHYGDHKKIFGMYLWADEEWGLSPAVASTASVSSTIDVYQPRRKASKSGIKMQLSNLHFGQVTHFQRRLVTLLYRWIG